MRRTDFCLLTSSYEHPRLAGSQLRPALSRLRFWGYRLVHVSAIRFGGPHAHPWIRHGGLVVPVVTRASRTSGAPVASPSRVMPLARPAHPREPPRPPAALPRERSGCRDDPGHLPSDKDRCPATPSRAPGFGLHRLPRLGHRGSGSRRLFACCAPLRIRNWARPPSTRPVAIGSHASMGLGIACRLLQPVFATRGHTQRAIVPRTRVELSPRYSPAPTDAGCVGLLDALPHRWPASHDQHTTACAHRVPLAWTRLVAGRSTRVKASRALLDDVARALLVALRAPVSPARCALRFGDPRDDRSGQDPTWMPPREGQHRRKDRGAFCRAGTLTRPEDCSSVRAWTAAPSRRLFRGIARELARLFLRF